MVMRSDGGGVAMMDIVMMVLNCCSMCVIEL